MQGAEPKNFLESRPVEGIDPRNCQIPLDWVDVSTALTAVYMLGGRVSGLDSGKSVALQNLAVKANASLDMQTIQTKLDIVNTNAQSSTLTGTLTNLSERPLR
jgi:hypothetical protein